MAALGTRAHLYAECRIKSNFYPEAERGYWRDEADRVGDSLPENYLENAAKYIRFVTDTLFGRENVIEWGVETKVPIWYEPNHNGTVDFWHKTGRTLFEVDYKSGRVEVPPEFNTQLLSYAIGLIDARFRWTEIDEVHLGIVQPFVGGFYGHNPKWWKVSIDDLARYKHELSWLAEEARAPLVRARLIPGEKQCRFCPAKALCPALEEESRRLLGDFEAPNGLTDPDLFRVLDKARPVRDFLDAVEDRIRELPDDTLYKHGWKKQKGARRFSWNKPEEDVVKFLTELKLEAYKSVLKTPTQVRDELGTDEDLEGMYQVDFNRPSLKRIK